MKDYSIQEIQQALDTMPHVPDLEDLDVMGFDDITGMTPNSNLATIGLCLDNIHTQLKRIAEKKKKK